MKLQPPQRKIFSATNIMLAVVVIALVGIGAYVLIDFTSEKDMRSSIKETHSKIITHADSSSGSESSKSSNSNDRPNVKSQPASKGPISSNPGLIGKGGSGDYPDEDDEDNGEKRGKKLRENSGAGSTEEEDSDDDSGIEEGDGELDEGVYWVDSKREGPANAPLVGSARP